jgi:hypothetical protein
MVEAQEMLAVAADDAMAALVPAEGSLLTPVSAWSDCLHSEKETSMYDGLVVQGRSCRGASCKNMQLPAQLQHVLSMSNSLLA